MAVNKVIYNSETLIDLTDSTVTPETLAEGVVAYNAKGERIVGTAKLCTNCTSSVLGTGLLGKIILGEN